MITAASTPLAAVRQMLEAFIGVVRSTQAHRCLHLMLYHRHNHLQRRLFVCYTTGSLE